MKAPNLLPSRRMQSVQNPIIPVIGELSRATPGTISLGQGVVYYGPPPGILPAMVQTPNHDQYNGYGPVEGMPALLDKFAQKLAQENGITTGKESRLLVTAGANMGFLNALFTITDPGDEIILPAPYYFNHEMAIRMLDCQPVAVETDAQFQLDHAALEKSISDRTRAIVTVSPNNPTGAVYSRESLLQVSNLCRKYGIYHISDEAYEYFTYNGTEHFSPGSMHGAQSHTISLFSMSKSYGFAGWRIGFMVLPAHLFDAVKKVQDTNLICPAQISQSAALLALEAGSGYCRERLERIGEVRERIIESLLAIPEICRLPKTEGAFYLFMRIMTDMDDMTLVTRLIREYRVAVIPGNTFGMQNGCYIRAAYGALDRQGSETGFQRLIDGLKGIINV